MTLATDMTKNVSTCMNPSIYTGRWGRAPADSTFFFLEGLQTEDPVKGTFPLHNASFFFPLKRKIRSHANRHVHTEDVQTCNSVKHQRTTLPNSPLVLGCINRPHHHVSLAKSSAAGLNVLFPVVLFFTCYCSSGKSLISNKTSEGSCEVFTSMRGLSHGTS